MGGIFGRDGTVPDRGGRDLSVIDLQAPATRRDLPCLVYSLGGPPQIVSERPEHRTPSRRCLSAALRRGYQGA
jgi:hypothetical protein